VTRETKFTPTERRLIDQLNTAAKVQRWLRSLDYNWRSGTCYSFRSVVSRRSAHCLEGAIAAACIMESHGDAPLLVSLSSVDLLDHVLFVFKRDTGWGSIARSRDLGLHGRKPLFRSVRDLVWSYFEPYIDKSGRITGYGIIDLRDLGGYDWRTSTKNVWKVERALQDVDHKLIRGSDARYERWYRRYMAFRAKYPRRQLTYFQDRHRWLV
jgi:hypothetical protein